MVGRTWTVMNIARLWSPMECSAPTPTNETNEGKFKKRWTKLCVYQGVWPHGYSGIKLINHISNVTLVNFSNYGVFPLVIPSRPLDVLRLVIAEVKMSKLSNTQFVEWVGYGLLLITVNINANKRWELTVMSKRTGCIYAWIRFSPRLDIFHS